MYLVALRLGNTSQLSFPSFPDTEDRSASRSDRLWAPPKPETSQRPRERDNSHLYFRLLILDEVISRLPPLGDVVSRAYTHTRIHAT